MKRQENYSTLSEIINSSKIYDSFEFLKQTFEAYKHSERVSPNVYEIQRQFSLLYEELEFLKNLLDDMIDESQKWEILE